MLDNSAASVAIRRHDYSPPAFAIDDVRLEFDLAPAKTTVTSTMKVRHAPGSSTSDLVLHGEDIELVSVAIDGQPWTAFTTSIDGLTISHVPAGAFTLKIVNTNKPAENTSLSGL